MDSGCPLQGGVKGRWPCGSSAAHRNGRCGGTMRCPDSSSYQSPWHNWQGFALFLYKKLFAFLCPPKALLRPGRIDRLIYVPLPSSQTRREIMKVCLFFWKISKCLRDHCHLMFSVTVSQNTHKQGCGGGRISENDRRLLRSWGNKIIFYWVKNLLVLLFRLCHCSKKPGCVLYVRACQLSRCIWGISRNL